MMARPRATSSRTVSGEIFSRNATYCISSVMTPARPKCICEKFLAPPFIAAVRFSIHVSLSAISPHSKSAAACARRNAASLSHRDWQAATRAGPAIDRNLGGWSRQHLSSEAKECIEEVQRNQMRGVGTKFLPAAILLAAISGPTFAHHGTSRYDLAKSITLAGTVTGF